MAATSLPSLTPAAPLLFTNGKTDGKGTGTAFERAGGFPTTASASFPVYPLTPHVCALCESFAQARHTPCCCAAAAAFFNALVVGRGRSDKDFVRLCAPPPPSDAAARFALLPLPLLLPLFLWLAGVLVAAPPSSRDWAALGGAFDAMPNGGTHTGH
jgi:hypothetical protein